MLALSLNQPVVRRCQLLWGVLAQHNEEPLDTLALLERCAEAAVKAGLAKAGDKIGITAGLPAGSAGGTNLFKVHTVEQGRRLALGMPPGRPGDRFGEPLASVPDRGWAVCHEHVLRVELEQRLEVGRKRSRYQSELLPSSVSQMRRPSSTPTTASPKARRLVRREPERHLAAPRLADRLRHGASGSSAPGSIGSNGTSPPSRPLTLAAVHADRQP